MEAFAKFMDSGKGEGASLQCFFQKSGKGNQWEIHGQTSVNFGQSSIKEQKDFLAY